ncbi:hypothetical protein Syun_014930 [Stephania yunnanensis]|uniref:Uncharacterized protein n=1 Tax=Stephania yunnanensis TaxID=152371 RepID=A0AAP0JME9_9MAGN
MHYRHVGLEAAARKATYRGSYENVVSGELINPSPTIFRLLLITKIGIHQFSQPICFKSTELLPLESKMFNYVSGQRVFITASRVISDLDATKYIEI